VLTEVGPVEVEVPRDRDGSFDPVISTTWPLATVRACLLQPIRNTFRYASRQDWDATGKQLRPIYTAPTAAAARDRFAEFADA
jgi:putative transposase